jgi:hypothetical protein
MAVIGRIASGMSVDPRKLIEAMERATAAVDRAKARAPEKPKGKTAPNVYRPAWLRRLGIVR